jgi:hypothetical protein
VKINIILIIAAIVSILGGCASSSSFELSPTAVNNYWYNGKSYDYNQYEISITCEPVGARIRWNGKDVGTTPFIYKHTGTLDVDDTVTVTAIPYDQDYAPQEAPLKGRQELPREMRFKLIRQKQSQEEKNDQE